jgi:hypothetical protein
MYGADAVGANGGRVEDEGVWYEAEVGAQLLEDEGLRGRRYPLSPQKFTACINRRLRPTIFCISICIPSNVMLSIVVSTCWASWYISRAMSYCQYRNSTTDCWYISKVFLQFVKYFKEFVKYFYNF